MHDCTGSRLTNQRVLSIEITGFLRLVNIEYRLFSSNIFLIQDEYRKLTWHCQDGPMNESMSHRWYARKKNVKVLRWWIQAVKENSSLRRILSTLSIMEYRYRLKVKNLDGRTNFSKSQSSFDERRTADAILPSSSSESVNEAKDSPPIIQNMPSKSSQKKWEKDKSSIALLLFLYLLQGVPLGMAGSIPLIIQTIGVSWSQQATFSFAFWPFSLKLLWAPLVDALYTKRFGRRKSWLIPTQYLIGFVMIILSYYINDILITTKTSQATQPSLLDLIFSLSLNVSILLRRYLFLDVDLFWIVISRRYTRRLCRWLGSVDALTVMYRIVSLESSFDRLDCRENVGWASTCNSVGQTAGYFLGNVVFLALESKDFANRYIRQTFGMELKTTGLITLPSENELIQMFRIYFYASKVFFSFGASSLSSPLHWSPYWNTKRMNPTISMNLISVLLKRIKSFLKFFVCPLFEAWPCCCWLWR